MRRLLRRLLRLRRLRRRLRRTAHICVSTVRLCLPRLVAAVALSVLLAAPARLVLHGSSARARRESSRASVAGEFADAGPVLPYVANTTAWRARALLAHPFAQNLIVSERRRYIFCPVPKASSTAWKYVLRRLDAVSDYADLRAAHSRNTSGLRYLSDYSPADVRRMLDDRTFFKFAVVRSPLSRLLSAYMDKIANRDPTFTAREYRTFYAAAFGWRAARERLGPNDTARTPGDGGASDGVEAARPTFAQFVEAISAQDPRAMNAHWRPQTLLCGLGVMPYHYVGRVESLSTDVPRILARIGAAGAQLPSSESIGFPPSGASRPGLLNRMYTPELRAMAHRLYATDFALLQYNDTAV